MHIKIRNILTELGPRSQLANGVVVGYTRTLVEHNRTFAGLKPLQTNVRLCVVKTVEYLAIALFLVFFVSQQISRII